MEIRIVCTIVSFILTQRSKLTKTRGGFKNRKKGGLKARKAHSRTLRLQMEVRRIPTVGRATLEK